MATRLKSRTSRIDASASPLAPASAALGAIGPLDRPVMTAGVRGDVSDVGPDPARMLERFEKGGSNREYKKFERSISEFFYGQQSLVRASSVNIWDFVQHAITGTGGFVDGTYLVPFTRERKGNKGRLKFLERVAVTKYDNFARRIAYAPWNRIVTHKDAIIRKSGDDLRLDAFWAGADRRQRNILDALEYPGLQARSYGTGWILVDRPNANIRNIADDTNPSNAPYTYCAPTRNVVDWEFDDDYKLLAVTILEPQGSDDDVADFRKCDVRIWTARSWTVFEPVGKSGYQIKDSGAAIGINTLGEVPAVQLFDGYPGPGRGLGISIMPTVARFERDVYNKISESREIQRKCAAFLGIPVKDVEAYLQKKIELGEDAALYYDGDAGAPAWVTPDLAALDKYAAEIKADKESAFEMAQMTAVSGYLQTTSGFHTEAIFQETNTAIASFAGQCENAEMQVARLVLRWYGVSEDEIRKKVSISYPTNFGIVDVGALLDRTQKRLDMELGVDDASRAILDLYTALYPREDRKQLEDAAKKSAAARYAAKAVAAVAQAQDATTARLRLGLKAALPRQQRNQDVTQGDVAA